MTCFTSRQICLTWCYANDKESGNECGRESRPNEPRRQQAATTATTKTANPPRQSNETDTTKPTKQNETQTNEHKQWIVLITWRGREEGEEEEEEEGEEEMSNLICSLQTSLLSVLPDAIATCSVAFFRYPFNYYNYVLVLHHLRDKK